MNKILLQGGRVIDPFAASDSIRDVLIVNGKIADVGNLNHDSDARIIDARHLVVAPGFIDLHTHLREPGHEDRETISSGTAAAARGGFTTVCCMPNTSPSIDSATVVEFINKQAGASGPVRVLCFGAVSVGRNGKMLTDMEELARAGVVGFTDDGSPIATGHLMQSALLYASELGLPIMDHCEDHSISQGLGMNEGAVSSRLGLTGYPSAAEESLIARNIAILEMTRGHFHVAHVSSAGSVELIRSARARGLNVTAEVTPHHLTMTEDWVLGTHGNTQPIDPLTHEAYETRAKVSPPLRGASDQDALIAGLLDGTITAIATDHAPHTFSDKAVPFEEAAVGISSLETAFGSLMGLVHSGRISLPMAIHRLTAGPASVLDSRFQQKSAFDRGATADLVVFDPDEDWIVDSAQFASKGKNTPLDGKQLKGRVKLAIAQGSIAFDSIATSTGEHN